MGLGAVYAGFQRSGSALLYDAAALDAAWELVKDWSAEERLQLRNQVPELALDAPFRTGTLRDIGRDVVAIAASGLKARRRLNSKAEDETMFLDFVEETVASGRVPADELLAKYEKSWAGDMRRIYSEYAF